MGIKSKTNLKALEDKFKKSVERYRKGIIRAMELAGIELVNEARKSGNYKDRTANLRNSTGFVIVENGKVIKSYFLTNTSGKSGDNPVSKSKQLAEEVAIGYQKLTLIIVAGMNYAAYVESKGYIVLASAKSKADELVKEQVGKVKII